MQKNIYLYSINLFSFENFFSFEKTSRLYSLLRYNRNGSHVITLTTSLINAKSSLIKISCHLRSCNFSENSSWCAVWWAPSNLYLSHQCLLKTYLSITKKKSCTLWSLKHPSQLFPFRQITYYWINALNNEQILINMYYKSGTLDILARYYLQFHLRGNQMHSQTS